MPECKSCGGNVERGERECPFCGASLIKHVATPRPGTKDPSAYTIEREVDRTEVHFGDGEIGERLPTGADNVAATYSAGGGAIGNLVCSKCKFENSATRIECEACGALLKRPDTGRLRR